MDANAINELLRCDQFQIRVAFITMGGVTPLLQTLKELMTWKLPEMVSTRRDIFSKKKRFIESSSEVLI